MHLLEVTDKATRRAFLEVNPYVNRGNPNYIRPLDKDIEEVFDPARNKFFRHGEARRWVLKNDQGQGIGRIAAFVNKRYKNKGDEVPTGGIGFFDCIDDPAAARLLFDQARDWLASKGMEAMDGSINFGERDRWWGVLVEGFDPPVYGLNYNPPYYAALFEGYGFQVFYSQICFSLDPVRPVAKKIIERHAQLSKDPGYRAEHIRKNNLEKYAEDFTTVYNSAWAGHSGLKEMRKEQVLALFRKMKPVMDEKIAWFVYYHDEPIAIFLNIPDLNQWFKYLNGKFDLWHKLKFLWYKATRPNRSFCGLIFGIVPKFQGSGVDAYMINESALTIQPLKRYTRYELLWIGDFNPKMINVAENFGETYRSRKLHTYRYLFDRTRAFKKHPILEFRKNENPSSIP